MPDLPTVAEALAFRDKINEGRAILGLEPIEKFDFDACEPNGSRSCLSATHLFNADGGGWAFTKSFKRPDGDPLVAAWPRLHAAFSASEEGSSIPPEILRVTDAFDRRVPGLREVLVEAGIVDA